MKKWVVLLFILILSCCISTPQKTGTATSNQESTQEATFETSTGRGPVYKGKIYALKDSVFAKFKPANIHGKFKLFTDSDDEDSPMVLIDQKISSFNNQLKWDVEYQGEEIGDYSIKGCLMTDEYGNFLRMESPFLIKEAIKSNLLKSMENFLFYSSFNLFLPKFNGKPVKSGDVFYTFIDLNDHFGEFHDDEMKVKISPSKITAILKGWANEGEKKLLVTEIRGKSTWREVGEKPFSLDFVVQGYSLIDPVTFQVVKSEVNYTLANIPDDDDPLRISYSAEIE